MALSAGLAVIVVGGAGASPASASPLAWQSPLPIGHGSPLTGMSCPTASLCVAVDEAGEAITSTDPRGGSGAWNTVQITSPLGGTNLAGISCPTPTLCVAIDPNTGQAFSSADPTGGAGAWSATTIEPIEPGGTPAANLQSVSCPSPSLCTAVDDAGNVFTSTDPAAGGIWQLASVNEGNQLDGISCPTTELCVAVGVGVATSTDPTGGPSAWRSSSALSAQSVSCADSHLCVAVDGNGNAYATTDPTGGPQAWHEQVAIDRSYPFSPLTGITCPAENLCVGVNASGDAVSSRDPTVGPWVAQMIDPNSGLAAVSCPDPNLCLAADGAGDVVVGTARVPEAKVSLPDLTVPVRQGRAALRIACTGNSACRGTITLTLRVRQEVRRRNHPVAVTRTVVLASAPFSVAAGHARTLTVRLKPASLRRLSRSRDRRLRVVARARLPGGVIVQRMETLTLR
ncbi:hypothetical protein [Conexibacter sp. DBS9H8]|uniref:hypothetical protein n=1 Tax=Conexibacter sp. DBS9H8 TaxID=2937801 RepID=UPI00200E6475|nr:hypothetical protein [Conexibacter sp. DBS9H8]